MQLQVGCLSASQVWSDMLQDGQCPEEAWTPQVIYLLPIHNISTWPTQTTNTQTYQHCFQNGGGALDSQTPYQIINRTGLSSLAWYGHNGIYVFTATVVAKDNR